MSLAPAAPETGHHGRPGMAPEGRSPRDPLLILRNLGLAAMAALRPELTSRQIAAATGVPESTVRGALAAGTPLYRALVGRPGATAGGDGDAEESPLDRAARIEHNARRRRTRPRRPDAGH